MGKIWSGVTSVEIVIPSYYTQNNLEVPICDEWNGSKSACFINLGHEAVRIPVKDVSVTQVAEGTPPGAGSFVSFIPFYTACKVGSKVYIIPVAYDSQNQIYKYFAVQNAEDIVHVVYAIDVNKNLTVMVYDASLRTCLVSNASLYVEVNGAPVIVPDNPAILIAVLAIGGVIGGLAAWGYVQHAEAEKIKAEAELKQSQALSQLVQAVAQKVKEGQTDVKTALQTLQIANHATLATVSAVSKPGDTENSWYTNIMNTIWRYVLPIALPVIGLIILIFKFRIILDFLESLFRRR